MKPLFHENMTLYEARITLFREVEGKTKEEIEEIKREYNDIYPIISENEYKRNEGFLA